MDREHIAPLSPHEYAYDYKDYMIVWLDKYNCWCIYNDKGDKAREPYWNTTSEAVDAIENGEAL